MHECQDRRSTTPDSRESTGFVTSPYYHFSHSLPLHFCRICCSLVPWGACPVKDYHAPPTTPREWTCGSMLQNSEPLCLILDGVVIVGDETAPAVVSAPSRGRLQPPGRKFVDADRTSSAFTSEVAFRARELRAPICNVWFSGLGIQVIKLQSAPDNVVISPFRFSATVPDPHNSVGHSCAVHSILHSARQSRLWRTRALGSLVPWAADHEAVFHGTSFTGTPTWGRLIKTAVIGCSLVHVPMADGWWMPLISILNLTRTAAPQGTRIPWRKCRGTQSERAYSMTRLWSVLARSWIYTISNRSNSDLVDMDFCGRWAMSGVWLLGVWKSIAEFDSLEKTGLPGFNHSW